MKEIDLGGPSWPTDFVEEDRVLYEDQKLAQTLALTRWVVDLAELDSDTD